MGKKQMALGKLGPSFEQHLACGCEDWGPQGSLNLEQEMAPQHCCPCLMSPWARPQWGPTSPHRGPTSPLSMPWVSTAHVPSPLAAGPVAVVTGGPVAPMAQAGRRLGTQGAPPALLPPSLHGPSPQEIPGGGTLPSALVSGGRPGLRGDWTRADSEGRQRLCSSLLREAYLSTFSCMPQSCSQRTVGVLQGCCSGRNSFPHRMKQGGPPTGACMMPEGPGLCWPTAGGANRGSPRPCCHHSIPSCWGRPQREATAMHGPAWARQCCPLSERRDSSKTKQIVSKCLPQHLDHFCLCHWTSPAHGQM